jgi:hypothetical protein
VHFGLVYIAFHYRYTYKFYPEMEEVREVYIATEKILVPENLAGVTESSPASDVPREVAPERSSETHASRDKDTESPEKREAQTGPDIHIESGKITPSSSEEMTFNSRPLSNFRLVPHKESPIDLFPLPKGGDNVIENIGKDYVKKYIDLSKYLNPGMPGSLSSGRKSVSGALRSGTSRRGSPKKKLSYDLDDYDLTPWARDAVDRIQRNWVISSSRTEQVIKDDVGITVIIKKTGEVVSYEITDPSEDKLLEQAAMDALNKSAPFPGLPDNFPYEELELYFVFRYSYE